MPLSPESVDKIADSLRSLGAKEVAVTGRCIICSEMSEVVMPVEVYITWIRGNNLAEIWPESTADQREEAISGTHGKCFDDYFGGDE